ncbi:protein ROOT INITIATION DEFECTIVE 3-like [Malus sylvestris]|uniref:protein ROOT INITIATION DEFECTIVE 3-like n=1 Tax=Malus sylvestris TaxID=3752 RepID=UPI0021ABA170|nr:protein ROOT INITIATION DEFECTIVE 3-like [Malus sylvestris]
MEALEFGLFIGKAVTCLAYGISGNYLISRSEDGVVRVWDARTRNILRVFKHAKGPVNNILVVRQHFSKNKTSNKSGALCIILYTHAELMCLCPDDLHSARKQRKRPFR